MNTTSKSFLHTGSHPLHLELSQLCLCRLVELFGYPLRHKVLAAVFSNEDAKD